MISLIQKIALSFLAITCLTLWWQKGNLKDELEQVEIELKDANSENVRLQALYSKSRLGIENLQRLANKALEREEKSNAEQTERELLLKVAQEAPRPNNKDIVDDDTRKKVALRLNRAL